MPLCTFSYNYVCTPVRIRRIQVYEVDLYQYKALSDDVDKPSTIVGWLVVLGLTALSDCISVYIGPSPRERENEKRNDRREKTMAKQPPPAPTASTVGPCPTLIQISRTSRH